ncbi:MAG: adenylosuccinate synthase [Desulfobacterales bacterium]|nr:adenylosuccinate synthase [Desulfobacterales bacterium]
MANIVIIGTQWGDEGKGKIVDLLAEYADIVVRFQGGSNAGHTMVVNGEKFISHLVPSGILQSKPSLLGNGMVVDPSELVKEIDFFHSKGVKVSPDILKISGKAHIVMPYHKLIDVLRESGKNKIGTTGRGIGPCYEDKVSRRGICFSDLLDIKTFREKVYDFLPEKNFYIEKFFSSESLNPETIITEYTEYGKKLELYVTDVSIFIDNAIKNKQNILFEGAQGTFLDIDHGTYPYVTSSNTVAANACCGSGIGPKEITGVLGVVKAYTTRVGNGPFPTELFDDIGKRLQKIGVEFGATTGRPRRCGWLDIVMLKNAVRLNSLTGLIITKLDVLCGLDEIKICTGYDEAKNPIYETMAGWKEDISEIKNFNQLPKNAIGYLKRIETLLNIPIDIVSVSPRREQTIILKNPFS